MKYPNRMARAAAAVAALLVAKSAPALAQLGAQMGLVEPNVAADSVMTGVPHVNAAIAEALKAARPILSAVSLDSLLASKSLTKAQRTETFGKMFVHVDVNRGADAEFMLIPGMDAKKLNAIKSGRPWKDFAAFRADIGKSTTATEAARIEQYLFIPIELNTWTAEIMDTFAGIGVGTRQWKREFAEYRPWTSMEQFDREISKYLRARPTELARLKRYVIINK
jgi:DNA uptake protein ComE-like DNA-binding protein